jgi:hypothetical protein
MPWRQGLTTTAIWGVSALLLAWPYLRDAWRRALAVGAGLAGLAFLVLATRSEGLREAPAVGDFLLGEPYVLAHTTASASLPWYVLTVACLLLALVGLAAGERAAEVLRRRALLSVVSLATAVALLRFALEKAAAPLALSRLFGVTWLAPVAGVFLLLDLAPGPRLWARFLHRLLAYALLTRAVVLALYTLASTLRLDSHYDITPLDRVHVALLERSFSFHSGSFGQFAALVLLPQALWIAYTLVAGSCAALLARALGAPWGDASSAARPRTESAPDDDAPLARPSSEAELEA